MGTARQLPAQLTQFVGRQGELDRISDLMADPACRLLTLVGPGGIGKTRLAVEAAQQLDDWLHFVSLQPLTSPDFMVSAIADALGLQFYPGDSPKQQLLDYLCDKSWLLVLDNFEHLLEGTDLLSAILAQAPSVRLIVTSRERLNLVEEWVLEVEGLVYPLSEHDANGEQYSAVELFVQHARRVKTDFRLTVKNQAAIARICRLLGGMPLGIELAASWVRVLSCDAIAGEIEHSLDILETAARNLEPRHRTIRAAFEPTWQRLSDEQRNVFMRLSVFHGGFTREAAEQVTGASLRILLALVDRSLLRVDADGRYDIHELLRQYGDEQLDASGRREPTGDAHSAYYADFIERRVEDLKGRRQLEAIAEIDIDFENVRTAWNWTTAHKREATIDQMIDGLWLYGALREREQDVRALFLTARNHFESEGQEEPSRVQRRLLSHAADEIDSFQTELETALEIARRLDDHAEIAFCLRRLGLNAFRRRDYSTGKQLLHECILAYRSLGDRYAVAGILFHLMSTNLGEDWEVSNALGEESLRLRREIGDRVGAAWSLATAAISEARVGHFDEAERLWLKRVTLGHEIGNLELAALSYAIMSNQVYFVQGDFTRARAAAEEAIKLATAIHRTNAAGWSLSTLGLLACMEERYEEGKTLCQQAAATPSHSYAADLAGWGLSIASCGLGDYSAARDSLSAALTYLINFRGLIGIIGSLPIAAILLAQEAKPIRAVELLALAFTHPVRAAGWIEKWPLVARLSAALEQELGSEAYSAAWERGKLLDAATVAEALRQAYSGVQAVPPKEAVELQLTERELEVLNLISDGLSNRDIAARLFLSPGTVKWYLSEIYSKLHVHGRMQAVARGRDLALLH